MRVFQNQPNTLDFDAADSMAAAQDVELTQKQLTGEIVPLKFVKFQNVSNIQFFFKVSMSLGNRKILKAKISTFVFLFFFIM